VLATSTFGADETPNLTIRFTDGTSVTTTYKAYDWSIGTDALRQSASIFGAAGINRYSATQNPGLDAHAFGMYETDINLTNINGVDYSGKVVASITFAATSFDTQNRGMTDVFAVSGAARSLAASGTQNYLNNVSVTADSGIDVSGSLTASMGTLGINASRLSVTSVDATTNAYSLSFGAANVTGSATIDIANSAGGGAGTMTVGALSGGGSITKTNSGTLKLAGASNVIGGNLAVNGGTIQLASSPGGGATPATLNVALLSLSGTGKIDLTDNELFTTSALSSVQSQLQLATLYTSSTGGVLGYMSTGSGTIEVRFTLPGDANLDGAVNVADLGALATSYGTSAGAIWSQGDANGDGAVDVGDLGLLATTYGQSIGGGAAAMSGVATVTASSAAVPEPGLIGVIGIGTFGALSRRRRR
jgi:hypothetical protein